MTAHGEVQRYFREVVLPYEGDRCLIWPYGRASNGYASMRRDGRMRSVTRFVCELEHGPAPTSKHEAAHSCGKGDQACVTKRHLSWKTSAENKADMLAHGTRNYGARNGSAKLTEAKVREIRALQGRRSHNQIASLFGISASQVGWIHQRKSWAWLAEDMRDSMAASEA